MRKLVFSLLLFFMTFQAYGDEPRVVELGPETLHLNDTVTREVIGALYLRALMTEGDIHILIDSPGGDFQAAQWLVANFDRLHKQGKTIHCYGNGQVASAAFFIYLHCDRRYALKSTSLFPHKIHIFYQIPVPPKQLLMDGLEVLKEQTAWDNLAIKITGMEKIDYIDFRDSDDSMWPIDKVIQKSKNKWFELVDVYVVQYK